MGVEFGVQRLEALVGGTCLRASGEVPAPRLPALKPEPEPRGSLAETRSSEPVPTISPPHAVSQLNSFTRCCGLQRLFRGVCAKPRRQHRPASAGDHERRTPSTIPLLVGPGYGRGVMNFMPGLRSSSRFSARSQAVLRGRSTGCVVPSGQSTGVWTLGHAFFGSPVDGGFSTPWRSRLCGDRSRRVGCLLDDR
jgi:hypothetical protein